MDATTRDAIVKTSMTASKPASPFNQKIPDFPVTAISFSEFLFFLIFSYSQLHSAPALFLRSRHRNSLLQIVLSCQKNKHRGQDRHQ